MVSTYTENVKELFDSGLVRINKVKIYNFRSKENREITVTNFMNDFQMLSKSEIFRDSVIWKYDTFIDSLIMESDMYVIQAEIGETEEITIHIDFNKENTAKEANKILLKWMEREKYK